MAMFVHLAPETRAKAIRRSGIRSSRLMRSDLEDTRGVYAFPVLPSYMVSHQWLRELKRGGARTIVGIYFRVPDSEPVFIGHYNKRHRPVTAADAAGFLQKVSEPAGYQVIVPRKITAKEIHRVRSVPQVVGWRYFPGAHGSTPCGCPVCYEPGSIKSRKIRDRWLAAEEAFEASLEDLLALEIAEGNST